MALIARAAFAGKNDSIDGSATMNLVCSAS
jgi:hypothetical protein